MSRGREKFGFKSRSSCHRWQCIAKFGLDRDLRRIRVMASRPAQEKYSPWLRCLRDERFLRERCKRQWDLYAPPRTRTTAVSISSPAEWVRTRTNQKSNFSNIAKTLRYRWPQSQKRTSDRSKAGSKKRSGLRKRQRSMLDVNSLQIVNSCCSENRTYQVDCSNRRNVSVSHCSV